MNFRVLAELGRTLSRGLLMARERASAAAVAEAPDVRRGYTGAAGDATLEREPRRQ